MLRSIVWGIIIMAIGAWVWLSKIEVLTRGPTFRKDWPLIIVVVGVMTAVEGIVHSIRRRRR